jgi:hypothetical protein
MSAPFAIAPETRAELAVRLLLVGRTHLTTTQRAGVFDATAINGPVGIIGIAITELAADDPGSLIVSALRGCRTRTVTHVAAGHYKQAVNCALAGINTALHHLGGVVDALELGA